jgi:hypothetical protein
MKLNSGTIKEVSVRKRISVGDFQIRAEERVAINEVLDAGRFSEWKKVNEFEKLFADYINTKHCVAVNSGTSAMIVGLSALIYDSRFPKVITHHIKRWLDGCELSQRQPFKPKVCLLHGPTQALPARIYFLTFFKLKTNC